MNHPSAEFHITYGDNDTPAMLLLQVACDGVIAEVVADGEVVATWAATAQELADDFCLRGPR